MNKKAILRFWLIFMVSTIAILAIFLTLSLLADFFISGLSTIPLILYVVYFVGSAAMALIFIIFRYPKKKFFNKRFILGIVVWLITTLLLMLGYLIFINWPTFWAQLKNLISLEFIGGFVVCLVLVAFSLFVTWCYMHKQKKRKSVAEKQKQLKTNES